MKYASKFDQIWHDLVVFTKEYWLSAVLCVAAIILFWIMISVFYW